MEGRHGSEQTLTEHLLGKHNQYNKQSGRHPRSQEALLQLTCLCASPRLRKARGCPHLLTSIGRRSLALSQDRHRGWGSAIPSSLGKGLHRQEPALETLCSPHPSMLCACSHVAPLERSWGGAVTIKYRGLHSQSVCQLGWTTLACDP